MEPKKEENLAVAGNKNERSRKKSVGNDEENNAKKPENSKETTKKSSKSSEKEKKLEKKLSRGEISKKGGKKSGKSKNKNAENAVKVDPDSGSLGDAETEEDSLQRALEIAADSIFKYPNY